MMGEFAKLFDVYGGQVLYTTEETDDGDPAIHVRTDVDGASIVVKLTGWKGEDAFDRRDKAFSDTTPAMAEEMRSNIVRRVIDIAPPTGDTK